jgi:hypothetical protein
MQSVNMNGRPSFNMEDTVPMLCDCGEEGDVFVPAFQFRKLSALLSESGREEIVPVQVFYCLKCGQVPSMFKPPL